MALGVEHMTLSAPGILTQRGEGAAWPSWPHDFIGFLPTSYWTCIGSNGRYLPLGPWVDGELSPQVRALPDHGGACGAEGFGRIVALHCCSSALYQIH